MKKRMSFLSLLFLLLLLVFPLSLFSTTRGISVTAKKGQSLYLYKDYHALVVGISDYEKWPDLPSAAEDAKRAVERAWRQHILAGRSRRAPPAHAPPCGPWREGVATRRSRRRAAARSRPGAHPREAGSRLGTTRRPQQSGRVDHRFGGHVRAPELRPA